MERSRTVTRTYTIVNLNILVSFAFWLYHKVRTGVEIPRAARVARVKNLLREQLNCILLVGDTFITGPELPFYRLSVVLCVYTPSSKSRLFDHEQFLLPYCRSNRSRKRFLDVRRATVLQKLSLIRKIPVKEPYIYDLTIFQKPCRDFLGTLMLFSLDASLSNDVCGITPRFPIKPKEKRYYRWPVNFYALLRPKKKLELHGLGIHLCSLHLRWSSRESDSRIEVAAKQPYWNSSNRQSPSQWHSSPRRGNHVVQFM